MANEATNGERADAPALLAWRWRDADERPALSVGGREVTASHAVGGGLAIRATDPSGDVAWEFPVNDGSADAANLVADGSTIYAALFRHPVTGARLVALDRDTGRPLWDVPLIGLGPLHHSKYRNEVQLDIVDDRVVAYGDESAGRYVEARDPVDGRLVAHRVERR